VVVTQEIIQSGKSSKGGWSKAQCELFGIGRLYKGWIRDIIGSDFPQVDVEKFVKLKDKHLKGKRKIKHSLSDTFFTFF